MRWPWELGPWGRGRGANASDSAAGDADSPAAGSADPASAAAFQAPPAATPAAWSRLPPLQRSVADSTAVAPPAAFRSSLTTHQNPSFLAPLGHLVDPDGPAGVVGGLASSVGGPIPYEGVDELRVPERPAPPSAPAVQRRIATLRPEEPVVQRHADAAGPTYDRGHDHDDPGGTSVIHTDSADLGGPIAGEPAAPETPASDPLVVARSAESPSPLVPVRPDATTLSAAEPSIGATAGPSPAVDAAIPTPTASSMTPLIVPVQRSATSTGSGPGSTAAPGLVADVSSPATLRPVDTPQTSPSPTPASEPVVARSAAEPGTQPPDPEPGGDPSPTAVAADPAAGDTAVTGLLADRPLVESSSVDVESSPGHGPAGDTAPLTVPSGSSSVPGSGPTLQRRFTDQPLPATSPSGSTAVSPVVSSVPASASGSVPYGPTAPAGPTTAGLDDQGYPPLIARSVQRSVGPTEAGPAATLGAAAPGPGSAPSGTPTPLSGFSAAISALQESPRGRSLGGNGQEPADGPGASSQEPPLVVARRVAPDQTGHLPAPAVHLQRVVTTRPLASPSSQVQRSLIAGGSPPATTPAALGGGTPTPSGPAVQRLRYEATGAPGGSRTIFEQPAEADDHQSSDGESAASAVEMPTAPASAAWSPVAPSPPAGSGTSGWSSPFGPSTVGPAPSGASRTTVQRRAAGTSPEAAGTTGYPRSGEPSAPMVSPPLAVADSVPMIQRRFDAPSSGTAVTPPGSADPPAMAVSSRTVGLAEMFAMAAAQPSADGATIQRSAETEVQPAADPPAAAPTPAPSAAPAGPAAPAAPMSGAELEEMARRLYEPLSARLRTELWQDRERSGLLTDLRP